MWPAFNNSAPDFAMFKLQVFQRRSDDPVKFDNVETFDRLNFMKVQTTLPTNW